MSDEEKASLPPVTAIDISNNALRMARILDRLYPGSHVIFLIRPERKDEAWKVEVFTAAKIMDRIIKDTTQ